MIRPTTPARYTPEVAAYLVALRDSAATNMWGAGPYLACAFDMSQLEADQCLVHWMASFDKVRT